MASEATQSTSRRSAGYPGTWPEFRAWFPDEAACAGYLERLRWPGGIACRACGERHGWRTGEGRWWVCSACAVKTSVTAGTIFDRTRTPLETWFAAAWWMTSQKHGLSAMGLQRALGLGSYQTAWMMLHRFRAAMVRPGRELLAGRVEVDESYVGGEEPSVSGRETQTKSIVAIAVELRDPKGFGRVRLARVPDVSAASLVPFVAERVQPGATVLTDGWAAYNGLADRGFTHTRTILSATSAPRTFRCPACTASPACSSAGCSAPTRAGSARSTSTPTSTSSPSASTAALRGAAACSSTASWSRLS